MENNKREKTCVWCKTSYFDTTKRGVGKTCSKACARSLGVSVRRANGTYERSTSINEKVRKTLLEQYKNGREPSIDGAKNWWKNRTEEQFANWLAKGRETSRKKYGEEHWTKTTEGRRKISELNTGKHVPPERMKALSLAALKSQSMHSRSKKGIRDDLGCFFRSTWEANYARFLNEFGIKWQYESVTYNLRTSRGDVVAYTPDFILENGVHVEIKGWLTDKAREKLELFSAQQPNIHLLLLGKQEYTLFEKLFRFTLKGWET